MMSMRLAYPKTLIFCHNYTDCAEVHKSLRKKLGSSFTEPYGYSDVHQICLVDMYTRASTRQMNLTLFLILYDRLLIATTAFSMGVDCQDICLILHFDPPSTITVYVEETDRAGRDGNPAIAKLHYGKPGKHINQDLKSYGENSAKC